MLRQPSRLTVGLVVAPFLLLAGCANNKEKDEMIASTSSARASADRAQMTANQALEAANTAQRTAEQALAAAQAANEKADRMFQRSLRK